MIGDYAFSENCKNSYSKHKLCRTSAEHKTIVFLLQTKFNELSPPLHLSLGVEMPFRSMKDVRISET